MKKKYSLFICFLVITLGNAQIINIPDANFKAKLLSANSNNSSIAGIYNQTQSAYYLGTTIDLNQNGEIEVSEALSIDYLDVSNSLNATSNLISNLEGLQYFTNLKFLNISNNLISSFYFPTISNLNYLNCSSNSISQLDLNPYLQLESLNCASNQISILDFDQLVKLQFVNCSSNTISTLDFHNNPVLWDLACIKNNLSYLNIKNGFVQNTMFGVMAFDGWVLGNPNLEYVCADEAEIDSIYQMFNFQIPNNLISLNSYCTFTPGGKFYTINGTTKIDNNNNGCDSNDLSSPNLKFNITDGNSVGSLISDTTGNYFIPVQAGTHIVSPVFENPSYFSVSPASFSVTFPSQSNPFTQDFCISANGSHSDVEVSIVPIEASRPGFDTKYRIVYKNKGNQVENGSVNFTFDDAKMDFVSASTVPTQSTGSLTWNYTNLQPFETRTIDVIFNINSPMETPAVNGGDILSFMATISSGNTDELPNDNTFTLNQTVVNSFDPNDITCLEGTSVSTSKIGDYVHYMIRFENTGSANATNIVVKDVVDAAKYDVNSIVPINGSHDFYTRVNGDKVEFIFENINLPFADATNDGYVSFKIKTKSTLVAGDTFSKNANIYFDYNFPIVTNTATTTIAALSNQDFEFKNYFKLYPNPVSNSLTIETKDAIEVSSVNIYNTLGQLVLVIPNAQNVKTVDVSSLTSGNFFIKINSNKGTSNTKFVKN